MDLVNAAFAAAAFLLLATPIGLGFLVGRRPSRAEVDEMVAERLQSSESKRAFERVTNEKTKQSLEARLREVEATMNAEANDRRASMRSAESQIEAMRDRIVRLEERMAGLEEANSQLLAELAEVAARARPEPAVAEKEADSEKAADRQPSAADEALELRWLELGEKFPALFAAAQLPAEPPVQRAWTELFKLPGLLAGLGELQQAADRVIQPRREINQLLIRLGLIPNWFDEARASLLPPIRRQTIAQVLGEISAGGDQLTEAAAVDLEAFLRGPFLEFADRLLRGYQEAQQRGEAAALEEACRICRELLRQVEVEPIEIVLGVTYFDGNLHRGRSQASDPACPEGTIVSAIRNGFRDLRHDQLLVQPEVIVNRLAAEGGR